MMDFHILTQRLVRTRQNLIVEEIIANLFNIFIKNNNVNY